MMKKVVLVVILTAVLVGSTGCRLPLLDPPIVGKWQFYGEDAYFVFNRDKTGSIEIEYDEFAKVGADGLLPQILQSVAKDAVNSKGEKFSVTMNFVWSYQRFSHVLTINMGGYSEDIKVEYNLFRTKATIYPPDYPNDRETLTLVSTPIFRL